MLIKYPVTSKNGNKYKVKFKGYSKNHVRLTLYRRILFIDIPLDDTFVENNMFLDNANFILETRKIVEMYEHNKGLGRENSMTITKFLDWDGQL